MTLSRGEIYYVELGPVRGREIDDKKRPVVVVSINLINRKLSVVTVVPGTSTPSPPQHRNVVSVGPHKGNGLRQTTYFRCDQIRSLDKKERLASRCVGRLSQADLGRIERGLMFNLGLETASSTSA